MAGSTAPKNNSVKNAKTGAARPATFYAILAIVALAGVAALYFKSRGSGAASGANAYQAMQKRLASAGPPKPYVLGSPSAPVTIEEFGDFECPACGRFATVTEADVRNRIIQPGLAVFKFYDFPLPMHRNTQAASNAAACADAQGKFWPMHDRIFAGQDQWGLQPSGEGELVDDPKEIFAGYARAIGLDVAAWQKCYDAKQYQPRIDGNAAEAIRRGVDATPTFYVNGKKLTGGSSYDELKAAVDAAARAAAPAAQGSSSAATAAAARTGDSARGSRP